ncbi:MAG TPA: SDR family oxidoreductase [Pseudomonadales bacterium]|nr:SDR family oxidoreductase [Pseudomonadales bacterium]
MKIQKGQVALVTGASRGLGVYIAREFAARGVNLVLAARSIEPLQALAAELGTGDVRCIAVQADMSRSEDVQALYRKACEAFGQIDYVVNNAGIELINDYVGLSQDDVSWVLGVNLVGPMLLSHLALEDMYKRNSGHIVNIASAAGYFFGPYAETYSATKAGLVGFTHSVRCSARQLGKRVSASVVAPGFLDDTGMYADMRAQGARKAPWFVSSLPGKDIAPAVIKVIERDIPIKLVMPYAPRVLKMLQIAMPKTFEFLSLKLGIFRTFVDVATHRASNQQNS